MADPPASAPRMCEHTRCSGAGISKSARLRSAIAPGMCERSYRMSPISAGTVVPSHISAWARPSAAPVITKFMYVPYTSVIGTLMGTYVTYHVSHPSQAICSHSDNQVWVPYTYVIGTLMGTYVTYDVSAGTLGPRHISTLALVSCTWHKTTVHDWIQSRGTFYLWFLWLNCSLMQICFSFLWILTNWSVYQWVSARKM